MTRKSVAVGVAPDDLQAGEVPLGQPLEVQVVEDVAVDHQLAAMVDGPDQELLEQPGLADLAPQVQVADHDTVVEGWSSGGLGGCGAVSIRRLQRRLAAGPCLSLPMSEPGAGGESSLRTRWSADPAQGRARFFGSVERPSHRIVIQDGREVTPAHQIFKVGANVRRLRGPERAVSGRWVRASARRDRKMARLPRLTS